MLYNSMRPEFIVQLPLLGALSAGLLLWSVLLFRRAQWEGRRIGLAACLLCAASASAVLFVRITAPTVQWRTAMTACFFVFAFAALCAAVAALILHRYKRKQSAATQICVDAFDVIDDCAMIFDDKGELAARNVQPEIEAILARAMTLNEMIGLLPDAAAVLLATQGGCDARLGNRDYYIRLVPVVGSREERLGTLVLWRDISYEMRLKKELAEQNHRISAQGEQLMQELHIEEELLAQREKQAMADAIQAGLTAKMDDTLRKIRVMQVEAAKFPTLQTQARREENLKSIAQELRAMLSEIRKFVYEAKKEARR